MKPQTILDTHVHPTVFDTGVNKKIIDAMKQFTKQEVTNFTDWTISDECGYSLTGTNQWVSNEDSDNIVTSEELYNIYLNTK